MIIEVLHVVLIRGFSLPVELRYLITNFFVCRLTDRTIKDTIRHFLKKEVMLRYGKVEWWDTSQVTTMNSLFNRYDFNQDISRWNVSNVRDMSYMFTRNTTFNQPLDKWNVSNVIIMDCMFAHADEFNQPIGDWDVSNVVDMYAMFYKAKKFNQPLEKWNLENINTMNSMFYGASNFNQSLNKWKFPSSKNVNELLNEATAFNQTLSGEWKKHEKHLKIPPPPRWKFSFWLTSCIES